MGLVKVGPGARPIGANSEPIQEFSKLQYEDSAAAKVSAFTLGAVTPVQLVVPANALVCVVKCSGQFKYGDNETLDGSGTGKGYKLGEAAVDVVIPCSHPNTAIYLLSVSGNITCDFAFAF